MIKEFTDFMQGDVLRYADGMDCTNGGASSKYRKLYVVADNDNELLLKLDKLILSNELDLEKEGIIGCQVKPVTKEELSKLVEKEKAMCRIKYKNGKNEKCFGTGFFCKINRNFPIK